MRSRSLGMYASVMIMIAVVGCGGPAIKRAPIDTLPEDTDSETKIEMLEEMKATYPDDANLYFELGNFYYDEAMPADSRINYEKAIELDPAMNKARVNLAMLLAETAEVDSAKALLEQAIAADPTDAKAYNNMGMIYYTDLDTGSAVKYFQKAIELEPGNVEAHYNLGLAFAESGLLLEAITEWNQVLEIDDTSETAQRARLSVERTERELKQ
jgi:tetratricopeptide (TPR) repeat protein